MKPLFKPREYVLLGVLTMIGGIVLNAYLPHADYKILSFMSNGNNSATGPGALILFGFLMALWPFLKRAWDIVVRRKNGGS